MNPDKYINTQAPSPDSYTVVITLPLSTFRAFTDHRWDDIRSPITATVAAMIRHQLPAKTERIPYEKITKAILGRTVVDRKSPINSVTFQTNSIMIHMAAEWGGDLYTPGDFIEVLV